MTHLLLFVWLLVLAAGLSALVSTVLLWKRNRDPRLAWLTGFLAVTFLEIMVQMVRLYLYQNVPGAREAADRLQVVVHGLVGLYPLFLAGLGARLVGRHLPLAVAAGLGALVLWPLGILLVQGLPGSTGEVLPDAPAPAFLPFVAAVHGLSLIIVAAVLTRWKRIEPAGIRRALVGVLGVFAAFLPLSLFLSLAPALWPGSPWVRDLQTAAEPLVGPVLYFLLMGVCLRWTTKALGAPGPSAAPDWEALGKRYGLSARELEVLPLLLEGRSNSQIGEALFIAPKTVKNHVYNLYQKLGVHTRIEALTLVQRPVQD